MWSVGIKADCDTSSQIVVIQRTLRPDIIGLSMDLPDLRRLVVSLGSIEKIERENPILGSHLLAFVLEVQQLCIDGYGHCSQALDRVLLLPSSPSVEELAVVSDEMDYALYGEWKYRLAKACRRLDALVDGLPKTREKRKTIVHRELYSMLQALNTAPGHLEGGIDEVMHSLRVLLGNAKTTGSAGAAKTRALEIQKELNSGLRRIGKIVAQIEGSSANGAERILRSEQMAERALQQPERVLILSMFFVIVLFSLGAVVFQYLKFYQFSLITGFTLTTVIVLNAFYLRTIDKLGEESFLKLMELALLKFFAPLSNWKKREPKVSKNDEAAD